MSSKTLTGTLFLFGLLALASDLVYLGYKHHGKELVNDGHAYCYYDNFFYGWYYRLATCLYLFAGGWMLKTEITPIGHPFWRLLNKLAHWTLFAEIEAIVHFFIVLPELAEAISLSPWNIAPEFNLVGLGIARWAVALVMLSKLAEELDRHMCLSYGVKVEGYRLAVNRTQMTSKFGCFTQHLADYIVAHYLVYQALFRPEPLLLDGATFADVEQFYSTQKWINLVHRLTHATFILAAIWFYCAYARGEFTLFSFIA